MKMGSKLTPIQKIELAEICKLVRKEMKKDCRSYEENKVCEIYRGILVHAKTEEAFKSRKNYDLGESR